ncbi:SpoIIE family protein phosphatase [Kineosporia rhizophila]|uniref:SpoIIE family protein phosphatase n=1 Tax=Kineosporia rhizophila TaxID=84633 RepID=UPI001E62AF59|nr:SpoIIE family protein phosphatase [Kineosporia rhizophila]
MIDAGGDKGGDGLRESELPFEEGVGSDRVRSAAMHQLPWYVIVYEGPEHRVAALNREFLSILDGFNPTGMRAVDYLGGSEAQGIIEIFDRAYAGEQAVFHRMRIGVVTPNGHQQEIVLDFEVSPFRDRHGQIVGVLGAGRDVTVAVRREKADAAAALELGRRYRRATDVIAEVQHALLPTRLPVLPAVQVAASYVVGGTEQAAGGDWFDVLPRPDGQVAAVVGDVVGHGVAAAAVMAQLRAVALERLNAGVGPAQTVEALDRFTRVVPAARSATVCVLVLEPGERTVTYCAAGHPPPLVLDGRGGARFLDPSGAPPLSHTVQDAHGNAIVRGVLSSTLGPGELVLLYTDGIVERPGVPATTGTVELSQTAAAAAADDLMPVFTLPSAVDRVTAQTLERLTRATGSVDDITLLAIQPTDVLPDLHVHTQLNRAGIPAVRAQLRGWLGTDRAAEHAVNQLDEILGELLENVVEHAYGDSGASTDGYPRPDGGGAVTVRAHLDELGTITLIIRDEGSWVPRGGHPVPGRGLGLAIAQDFADQVQVDHSPDGTTVTVTFTPWKDSHGSTAQSPRPVPGLFDTYTQHRDEQAIMTVLGPVDAACVPELDAQLALNIVPGVVPLVVDLQQVTVLSSAAIHALRRRLEQAGKAGVAVQVVSSPGTVAHQVLSLVGIDTAAGH